MPVGYGGASPHMMQAAGGFPAFPQAQSMQAPPQAMRAAGAMPSVQQPRGSAVPDPFFGV